MVERPLDKIHIRDLEVRCALGVHPEERRAKQAVIINITLHLDLRSACRADRIEETADYEGVESRVLALAAKSECCLLERLAERVAAVCLEDPMVQRVEVAIDKPGALRFARSVAVEIARDRVPHCGQVCAARNRP